MKTYIGIKRIEAELALRQTDTDPLGQLPENRGYRVRYEDGYTSWSPAAAFEAAYVEAPEGEADLIVAKLRGDLVVLVEHPPEQDAGPDLPPPAPSFGGYERRSLAVSYALQATQPVYSSAMAQSPTPKKRTAEEVIEAATKILAFIEGGASLAPGKPPA